jgi:hypothetical protein
MRNVLIVLTLVTCSLVVTLVAAQAPAPKPQGYTACGRQVQTAEMG